MKPAYGLTLLNVGFGTMLPRHRVVAIVVPLGAPMKRMKDLAREAGKLVDATQGRRTRAMVLMDTDHVILSALQAETLAARFHAEVRGVPPADRADEDDMPAGTGPGEADDGEDP